MSADRLLEPSETSPVSLALAKQHLLISHSADDALINQIIAAATKYGEEICNRSFVEAVWQALFPAWPEVDPCKDTYLELSRGNLNPADLVVQYVDSTGAEQMLASSVYLADDANVPGRIRLAPDQSWPETQKRWDAVRVTYTVGWIADEVPEPIVQALLLLIGTMYEYRTNEITGSIVSKISFSFEHLLSPYRIITIK